MNAVGPTQPTDRIATIDILRGLALFGVLAVNLVTEFRVSIFQQFLQSVPASSSIDHSVETFISLWLESKALCAFSFLFGVGLAIQYERLSRYGSPIRLLVRRLVALLVLGLIHLFIIWNGDILAEYAIAGFIALPFLFLSRRWLLVASMGFFLFHSCVSPFISYSAWANLPQHVAEANRIYPTGSALQVLGFSVREIRLLLPLHVFVFPRTVALFLLGAFCWQIGLFRRPDEFKSIWISAALIFLSIGGVLTYPASRSELQTLIVSESISNALLVFAPITLSLGYLSTVVCLIEFAGFRRLFAGFGRLGRMAFTNYILQSLIFVFIFYSYGLGLFGKLGAATALSIGIAVYVSQIVLSMWWLRRHRFGPIEWLWRSLMYGRKQPMTPTIGTNAAQP